MSAVAAAVVKYGTLAMTGVSPVPPLYFDGVPQTNASGTPLVATTGYVNLIDEGTSTGQSVTSGYDFEADPVEVTTLLFEVFGPTLVYVDAVMVGIKYATGTVAQRLGFDFGTLTISGQQLMECVRTHEQRSKAPQMSPTATYVYRGEIRYEIQAKVN